jgi:hypothetical protein
LTSASGSVAAQQFIVNTAGSAASPAYRFSLGSGFFSPSGTDHVAISTASTERLVVDGSGNVGIGTSSPSGVLNGRSLTVAGSDHSEINFVSAATGFGSLYFGDATSGAQRYAGYLEYSHSSDYLRLGTGTIERMRLDSSGNVGINTTSPSYRLQLGDNTSVTTATPEVLSLGATYSNTAGDNPKLRLWDHTSTDYMGIGVSSSKIDYICAGAYDHVFYTNSAERLRIDSSGKMLLGTTTDSGATLTVYGASSSTVYQNANTGVGATGNGMFVGNWGSVDGYLYNYENANLIFGTNSTEQMRITSAGTVGLGTTTPSATLHVTTANGGASIQIGDSSSAYYQYVNYGSTGTGHYGWQVGRASSGATFAPANGFFIYNALTGLTEFGIDPNGHIGMGTQSPYQSAWGPNTKQVHVSGTQYAVLHMTSTTYGSTWSHGCGGSLNSNYMAYDGTSHWLTIGYGNGSVTAPGVYNLATSGAANVHVTSAGQLYRSTSSIKYKTDVETLEDQYADAILNCRPVWYRSVCDGDIVDKSRNKSEFGYYGFIAEEVADIDPRLVSWKTKEIVKTDDNWKDETVDLDPSEYEAEGVNYTNFVPLLLNLIKRQKTELEALKEKVEALESA